MRDTTSATTAMAWLRPVGRNLPAGRPDTVNRSHATRPQTTSVLTENQKAMARTGNTAALAAELEQGEALRLRTDNQGGTLLHVAAASGQNRAVELLLAHGSDPNSRDSVGATSLHYAVLSGDIETVDLLIRHRADQNAVTHHGASPLILARMYGRTAIYEALRTRFAR